MNFKNKTKAFFLLSLKLFIDFSFFCSHILQAIQKSAILSPSKKERLKEKNNHVKFADDIATKEHGDETEDDLNLNNYSNKTLKVFLENGQTKTTRYDDQKTVQVKILIIPIVISFLIKSFS